MYTRPDPKPPARPKKAPKRLARYTWMRKKPPRRIARETLAEKYYKWWIHRQRCVCGCSRPVQQSHLRCMTGLGRKESNVLSIAQCAEDHQAFTEARGRFAGMSKMQRFAWFMLEISKAHGFFLVLHGCAPEAYAPTGLEPEIFAAYETRQRRKATP